MGNDAGKKLVRFGCGLIVLGLLVAILTPVLFAVLGSIF